MIDSSSHSQFPVILMIDDNPTDIFLIKEAFALAGADNKIQVAEDGIYAMEYLKRQGQYTNAPRPDIILLDLNMPRKGGLEVLMELKTDLQLRSIPVIVYTSSVAKDDVASAYNHHANGYIRKASDFDGCIRIVRAIREFWFNVSVLYKP